MKKFDLKEIGDVIYQFRREKKMSIEDFSLAANVNTTLISRLENGKAAQCYVASLVRIANAMGLDLSQLISCGEK